MLSDLDEKQEASFGQGVGPNEVSNWIVDATDYLTQEGKFLGTQRLQERQRTRRAAVFAESSANGSE